MLNHNFIGKDFKLKEETALDIYKKKYKEIYYNNLLNGLYVSPFWSNDYSYFKDVLSEEDFKKALRLKNRKSNRRKRCHKKLVPIINQYEDWFFDKGVNCYLVFGTCTFNDNALKLKEETRTKYVNKWIKSHFKIALVNIDYGRKNEREHHHFIGLTFENIEDTNKRGRSGYSLYNLKNKDYKLGWEPDLELICIEDNRKLSNYLVKLNFHSNKKSTKNRRIRVLTN